MDDVRKQALLNEYKGNLFEYLIAFQLARSCNLEKEFLTSLSEDMRNMLRIQECYIRENFPHLLQDLPLLADMLLRELMQYLEPSKITSVDIIGKIAGASHRGGFAEADMVVEQKEMSIPVSIKLSKAKAFVNTKSGGIKSFLKKYFPGEKAIELQTNLNKFVDESFHSMGFRLHEMAGLEYPMHFQDWVSRGYSELPGKLNPEYKEIVHELYYAIIQKLHKMMLELQKNDPVHFARGVLPLIGVGDVNLLQATCFYNSCKGNYILDQILIERGEDICQEVEANVVSDYRQGLAHFEIQLKNRILQIRIKPMNKFTAASFKVNCSVKKRS